MRVVTNTFFGLGGLLDPATEMGLVKRPEDFGQTLGVWGLSPGPYMVLPLLGPSTVRDTAGTVLDRATAPSVLPPTTNGKVAVTGVELVDTRTRLLSAGALLDQVALDRYSFLRDAYLAQRRDAVYDGAPPMDTFEDDGAALPGFWRGCGTCACSRACACKSPGRTGASLCGVVIWPLKPLQHRVTPRHKPRVNPHRLAGVMAGPAPRARGA